MSVETEPCDFCGLGDPGPEHCAYAPMLCSELEVALVEARRRGPARSPAHRVADEEVVIAWLRDRDARPARERMTLRWDARDIIDRLDAGRARR